MNRYLHGCIIKRFEVTKIGKKNQLYLLDNNELEYVYNELSNVLDLDIFDIIKSNNSVQVVLKENIIDTHFKELVKEFDSICDLNGKGFVYEDDDSTLDKALFVDELVYGNMCACISEKLEKEGYNVQLYVSNFILDYNVFIKEDDFLLVKLLTGLSRKAIINKLSSALVFAFN